MTVSSDTASRPVCRLSVRHPRRRRTSQANSRRSNPAPAPRGCPMLHTHHVPSVALGLTRRITVWLPPGVRASARYFPVLYLNDGQNLFDPGRAFGGVTWGVRETVMRLVRRNVIPPLIVVGIDHGAQRRARELLPVEDDRNRDSLHPLGRAYVEFVTREVMPFVAKRYPVDRRASNTGFGGSSYGGVAALFATLERPGVFGRLLIES